MSLTAFMKLVEIQTKAASISPFLLANLYLFYNYSDFKLINFLIFLISLLFVDMAATALNNFQDYKLAEKKKGFNYEKHNAVVNYNLAEKTVKKTIILLFSAAVVSGILLFLLTDVIVLIVGIISFIIAILYSFGPVPISRTPAGELFSGFTMGFFIPFLSIYIHKVDLIKITLTKNDLILNLQYLEILNIFIFSIPIILGISNIMLANNICDIKDDLENKRYTLPIYISLKNSLKLFKYLYYFSYLAIVLAVVINILPLTALLTILTIFKLQQNINKFEKKQSKKDTFALAIQNFIIINFSLAFSILIVLLF